MDELFDRIIEIARTGISILMVEQNARQALEHRRQGLCDGAGAQPLHRHRRGPSGRPRSAQVFPGRLKDGTDQCLRGQLSNFVLIPALAYGSQLALGALGITLIFGILRFAALRPWRHHGLRHRDR
jgi:hypothetical protein